MAHRGIVEAWCESRGVTLRVVASRRQNGNPDPTCPDGWKWDFRMPGKFAQWRPFAGRLHYKTELMGGVEYVVKVHDYEQLLAELEVWRTAGSDGGDRP
jgi:hypothetical protein